MTRLTTRLARTAAILGAAAAAAGCASTAASGDGRSSTPDRVIVNDPKAGPGSRARDLPPLPLPSYASPMHDELPAEPIVFGDVLDRIRRQMVLPQVEHPWVRSELEWYERNSEYLARVFGRGQRYLYHIAREVEARGMPGELALLPVVESAFNPFAYSRSHASGLWQFIAPTGERFGLQRNFWKDQRRDVLEATRAALDYLELLRDRFEGDWFLAIAAYNYGSGNVRRAINRNQALGRPTDFFSLSLPAETRAYVPKLLALSQVVRDPVRHGLSFPTIPDTPYFRVVPTGGPVDLRLMAELAGVQTDELHALNPAWNRWLTDPDGPHRLLVPEVVADSFSTQLAQLDAPSRARLGTHRVAPGESVTSVAGRYQVPESFLQRVNGIDGSGLRAGDALLVPAGDVSQLRAGLGADLERRLHQVQPGESLWSISRRHGMTVAELARMNNLSASAVIQPGQRLQVAGSGPAQAQSIARSAARAAPRSINYRVQRGDTLSSIARRFEVTVRQLQGWNDMGGSTVLRAGQRLTIHVDGRRDFGG